MIRNWRRARYLGILQNLRSKYVLHIQNILNIYMTLKELQLIVTSAALAAVLDLSIAHESSLNAATR